MRLFARLSTTLIAVCLLAQCASPRRPPADPFSGEGGGSSSRARTYRVALEVACDRCRVNYQVGPRGDQDSARGVWREEFTLGSLQRTAVRLTATVVEDGASVRGVRIVVDGATVAEAGCGACDPTSERLGGGSRSYTVEALVPPR